MNACRLLLVATDDLAASLCAGHRCLLVGTGRLILQDLAWELPGHASCPRAASYYGVSEDTSRCNSLIKLITRVVVQSVLGGRQAHCGSDQQISRLKCTLSRQWQQGHGRQAGTTYAGLVSASLVGPKSMNPQPSTRANAQLRRRRVSQRRYGAVW